MMYSLIERDPNFGYIDTWLWVPKSRISVQAVKKGLSFSTFKSGSVETIRLWIDAPNHLGVPRARLTPEEMEYDIVDLRPMSFKKVEIHSKIELDRTIPTKDDQRKAFEDFSQAGGGILNMSCGKGKTVICLHTIAHWKEPALIICSSNLLMEQWKREIATHLDVEGGVGWIQGAPKKWDWNRPIVIASLKTLAMYRDQSPPEMLIHFGRIIWDEIHHLSAKEFSKTASLFVGHRYGASATTSRADGMEFVYYWHVGKEVHTNLTQDVIPTILFRKSRTTVDLYHKDVVDVTGQPHLKRLARHVGLQEQELSMAVSIVQKALDAGRDIVAITTSKDHARALHARMEQSGILDADVPVKDRLEMLKGHKVTFGTVDMLSEALDKKELNSLLILTEFSSHNRAQQSVGRIQRSLFGTSKNAKVIVLWHVNVAPMKRMGFKLMSYFKKCGFEVKVK